jgi:hypothetical protein
MSYVSRSLYILNGFALINSVFSSISYYFTDLVLSDADPDPASRIRNTGQ